MTATTGMTGEAGRSSRRRARKGVSRVAFRFVAIAMLLGFTVDAAISRALAAEPDRRLYVTGIVGSSLGGGNDPNAPDKQSGGLGSLASPTLGGDAALGVAIDRPTGAVRLEFEGRTRQRTATGTDAPRDWSTMANVWRDVPLTKHVGVYAGGGVGAGGSHAADGSRKASAAWQAGGGVTYAANERVTFDVGYRAVPALPAAKPFGGDGGVSGELLLSVRLYDPLRGWRR